MRKTLYVFSMLVFLTATMFAQTTITVFDQNRIQWGGSTGNVDPVYDLEGGRMIARDFKVSDGTIPQSLFDSPVNIVARVSIKPVMVDDTTMADQYIRAGGVYASALGSDDRYELARFITPMGGQVNFDLDVTRTAALLKGDFTVYLKVDTWTNPSQEGSLELIFTPDAGAVNPFWISNVVGGAAGNSTELLDGRFDETIMVPADVNNFGVSYTATGHGGDTFSEIANTIYVDEVAVYTFEPWRDDCEDYLDDNPLVSDTAGFITPRAGWCLGAPIFPTVISNDLLNTNMGAGEKNIRFEPDMTPNNDSVSTWWNVSGYTYGSQDMGAGAATKIEITGPASTEFLAHGVNIPVRLDMVNAAGYLIHGVSTTVELSSTGDAGLLFSADGQTWTNPLTVPVEGSSVIAWMKGSQTGTYQVGVTDQGGSLTSPAPMEVKINYNSAAVAYAFATDSCGAAEAPRHAIDGDIGTKWCSNHQTAPYDLNFGFASTTELNYFIIKHAGAGGENTTMNTIDYDILVYNNATSAWETAVEMRDNFDTEEGNVTYHYLSTAINADSVRFHVITPESGGNVARIYEFEMYNTDSPLSVGDSHSEGIPETYFVKNNYPNPFNPSTTIEFFTPNRASVDVRVYNILGQSVSTLLNGVVNKGTHSVVWNGRNSANAKVAGGVYFYSIRFKDDSGQKSMITKKMILLP